MADAHPPGPALQSNSDCGLADWFSSSRKDGEFMSCGEECEGEFRSLHTHTHTHTYRYTHTYTQIQIHTRARGAEKQLIYLNGFYNVNNSRQEVNTLINT